MIACKSSKAARWLFCARLLSRACLSVGLSLISTTHQLLMLLGPALAARMPALVPAI